MNSETISAWASKFTVLSLISTFLSWLASSEAAVLIGIAATLGGSFVNWYYKRKAYNRRAMIEAEESEMRRREDARQAALHAADETRKQELHAARMDFLRRANPDACDVDRAALLGIDTSDFGQLGGSDG